MATLTCENCGRIYSDLRHKSGCPGCNSTNTGSTSENDSIGSVRGLLSAPKGKEGGVELDLEDLRLGEVTHGIGQFNHSISAVIKTIAFQYLPFCASPKPKVIFRATFCKYSKLIVGLGNSLPIFDLFSCSRAFCASLSLCSQACGYFVFD